MTVQNTATLAMTTVLNMTTFTMMRALKTTTFMMVQSTTTSVVMTVQNMISDGTTHTITITNKSETIDQLADVRLVVLSDVFCAVGKYV